MDSSVFIEGAKQSAPDFFKAVTKPAAFQSYISDVVCSETWYHFLGLMGGASPLALKQRTSVHSVIRENQEAFDFYHQYILLPSSLKIVKTATEMMGKYNLLPNDALIISTCIAHHITHLASHDSDFIPACAGEGLILITPENYLEHLPTF